MTTIANLCILAACALPIVCAGLAKASGWGRRVKEGGYNNRDPRAWLAAQTGRAARANAAQDQADEMNDSRTRERKEFELQREKRRELHAIEMSELEKELELEKTRRMAQADIKRQLLEQEINHEREVAKLTGQILQDQVHQSAAAIAQRKARAARDRFIAGMGLAVEDFPEGSNGNGRR